MMAQGYPEAEPYCIGRFIVALPPFASLHAGASRYDGVTIEFRFENDERYDRRVHNEIEERKRAGEQGSEFFFSSDRLNDVVELSSGHILVYGKYDFAIGYVHDPIGTWTLKNAYAADYRRFAERIEFRGEPGKENLPEGRCYCIMYGFIPETSPTGNEWEERYLMTKDDPEFILSIQISMIGKQRDSLKELERKTATSLKTSWPGG
ncbi:hypothetical protein KBTX_04168 [wastewater metagenome]|uniref:Uncharacterized protein n=4 Tax=root TaxID=1 RepID=A0A5B8RID5_9ZZZZ|nr:hypothetical protein KBTEX_04168 [uncultured organism]